MTNKAKQKHKTKSAATTTATTTPETTTTTTTTTATTPSPTFHQLVDKDEVSHQVCKQLNEVFAGDPGNLWRVKQLLQDLEDARQDLQQRLQFTTTAAPDKITRAVKSAETALGDTRHLVGEAATLQDLVTAHREKVGGLLGAVGEGVRRVGELERVEAYQALVSTVEEWSQDISSALHIGAEGQALVGYTRLVGVVSAVKGSGCKNLRRYFCASLLHWNKALLQRFVGEFEGVLKSIKWPLSDGEVGGGAGGGAGHPPPPPEATQRLCTLTQYLLQLSLPDDVAPPEEDRPPSPPVAPPPLLSNFDPPLLPIQLLLNPLQVRFLYHFSGGRATNSRSHPEWYFIQLLKWAGSHDHLLTHRLQPVLERCGRVGVSAKVEFLRGLVRLAAIKLTSHLSELSLDEDDLFAQTVQETLHFERELFVRHGYPPAQPSILCVLTDGPVFQRWLALERKFAIEVMDELVSADGAWETNYNIGSSSGGGGGGGETARCGEQVILLLQGITDRYKRLPQPGHRLQFLELQLDLLDDFRVRLLQVRQGALRDPLASAFPALLNTAHHLSSTLADWADLPFFIEMQYYQETFCRAQQKATTTTTTPSSPLSSPSSSSSSSSSASTTLRQRHQLPTTSSSSPPPPPSSSPPPPSSSPLPPPSPAHTASSALPGTPVHMQEQPAPPTSTQLAEVTGSVFDSVRTLYTHMEGEMVHTLAMYVFSEVRARSQPYRRDRWHRTQADAHGDIDAHERRKMAVKISEASPSVCPLLEVLARHLHTLRDTLATPLFHRLWVEVADTLDKYVLEEVVLETRFSFAGAHQFKFDMTHGLFPIFGEFTQRPDNYFRRIKESAILLTLPLPTVLLLQDALSSTSASTSDGPSGSGGVGVLVPPRRALGEHGVTLLSPSESAAVLNARIYDLE